MPLRMAGRARCCCCGHGNSSSNSSCCQSQRQQPPQHAPTKFSKLHNEVLAFAAKIAKEQEPVERNIEAILDSLRSIVSNRWDDVSVELFGSRSTGLALTTSDVDVVLLGSSFLPADAASALTSLESDLEAQSWVKSQALVLSARIPVLKVMSVSDVPVDITIACSSRHTGLAARDLIRGFCQSAPPLAPLVLVVKTFLRSLQLNDPFTGGMSSYCIVVLLYMYWSETDPLGCFNSEGATP